MKVVEDLGVFAIEKNEEVDSPGWDVQDHV